MLFYRLAVAATSFVCLTSLSALAAIDKTISVVVMKAEKSASFENLTYPAKVLSMVDAVVSADFDGVVVQVLKPLGSKVSRGDTILYFQNSDPTLEYAPAAIKAPVAGLVGLLKANAGTRILRGQPLVSVTDPRKTKVIIELAASDFGTVRIGQAATFKMNGKDSSVSLRVKGVSPAIDPVTGTSTCELEQAPGGERLLVPGQVGQVGLKINERQAILVPEHALYYKGQETFVRLVGEDKKARKVAVKVGAKSAGQVEILEGVKVGEQIVVRASGFLADDEPVEIQARVDAQGKTVQ